MTFDEIVDALKLTTPADLAAARIIYRYGQDCGAASRAGKPLPPAPAPAATGLETCARNAVLFAEVTAAGFDAEYPQPPR